MSSTTDITELLDSLVELGALNNARLGWLVSRLNQLLTIGRPIVNPGRLLEYRKAMHNRKICEAAKLMPGYANRKNDMTGFANQLISRMNQFNERYVIRCLEKNSLVDLFENNLLEAWQNKQKFVKGPRQLVNILNEGERIDEAERVLSAMNDALSSGK